MPNLRALFAELLLLTVPGLLLRSTHLSNSLSGRAGERLAARNTHGTGCTYSAALATFLGQGKALVEAARLAKEYTLGAILHAPGIGHGHGPTHHFWRFDTTRAD